MAQDRKCGIWVKAQDTALKDNVLPSQFQKELFHIIPALLVNTVLLKSNGTAGAHAGRDVDMHQVHYLGKHFKAK